MRTNDQGNKGAASETTVLQISGCAEPHPPLIRQLTSVFWDRNSYNAMEFFIRFRLKELMLGKRWASSNW